MRLSLLLFFSIAFQNVYSDNLILSQDNDIIAVAKYCFTYEDETDTASLHHILHADWNSPKSDGLNFGIAMHPQWIKLNITNTLELHTSQYLYIPYHHIEFIDVYILSDDSLISKLETGTARPYTNKAFSARGYPVKLDLKPHQNVSIYIKVDHRFLPLRASLFLLSEEKMFESLNSFESLMWFWKGVIATAVLLSLITFFFVRTRLFLYYALLLLGIVLFVGLEIGDYFQFFEVDPRNTIIDIKHIGNILVIYSFPMFINELSPLRELHPRLWKWTMWLIIPFAVLFILVLINPIKETIILNIITNYAIYISALIFFMQLVFLLNATLKKKKNALLLFAIYSVYIGIFWITNSLPNLGITKDESVNVYAILLISSILEILTFLFLIARETLQMYKERTLLIEQRKTHQKNLLLATVDSQERERNKVGRELHDMVGANMAVIKQKIDRDNKELRNIVGQTIEVIRNLSHGLITPQVKNDEFADEIRELCILSSTGQRSIQCFFHNWEDYKINHTATIHLYRIVQELLQNALKHSNSSKVSLQFSFEESELILMYDDNGIGLSGQNSKKGIGILNIENRVKLLHGSLFLERHKESKGASIMMQFPVSKITIS